MNSEITAGDGKEVNTVDQTTEARILRQERILAERKARAEENNRNAIRMSDAAERILGVADELHLTWREFEEILSDIKCSAYICSKPSEVSEQGDTL